MKSFNVFKKKKFIFSLSIIVLLFMNQYVLASSEDYSIIDFVSEIYQKYSQEDFKYIYEKLHPALKDIISEKEYISFQEENFRKYGMEISGISIPAEIIKTGIPDKFADLINSDEEVHRVKVSYEMKFRAVGSEQSHKNEKDVLVLLDDENLYLLWDPSVVNE